MRKCGHTHHRKCAGALRHTASFGGILAFVRPLPLAKGAQGVRAGGNTFSPLLLFCFSKKKFVRLTARFVALPLPRSEPTIQPQPAGQPRPIQSNFTPTQSHPRQPHANSQHPSASKTNHSQTIEHGFDGKGSHKRTPVCRAVWSPRTHYRCHGITLGCQGRARRVGGPLQVPAQNSWTLSHHANIRKLTSSGGDDVVSKSGRWPAPTDMALKHWQAAHEKRKLLRQHQQTPSQSRRFLTRKSTRQTSIPSQRRRRRRILVCRKHWTSCAPTWATQNTLHCRPSTTTRSRSGSANLKTPAKHVTVLRGSLGATMRVWKRLRETQRSAWADHGHAGGKQH